MEDAKIVIINSKVKHSLVDSAYNDRRNECETALRELQAVVNIQSLGELTEEAFEEHKSVIQSEIRQKRAKHAVYENQRAIRAVEALKAEGINARLINIHTIKPIDKDIIIKAAKETGHIITVEEHSIIGGLGSAVAEVLAEEYPCKMTRMGVKDVFGQSGKPYELLDMYGLTDKHIVAKVKEILNK